MEAMGINLFSIIIYTVLFVILMLVLKKYLAAPLTAMLDKRAQDLAAVKEQSDSIKQETARLQAKEAQLAGQVRDDIKSERETILAEAREERRKIINQAKDEADAIITKANLKMVEERKTQEAALESKVEMAVKKVLKEVYRTDKEKIDAKLIEKALEELA